MAIVHVPLLTPDGAVRDNRGFSGGSVLRRLAQTSRVGASTERHGGGPHHPPGTLPLPVSRKARPSDQGTALGAKEGEARPTRPLNVS